MIVRGGVQPIIQGQALLLQVFNPENKAFRIEPVQVKEDGSFRYSFPMGGILAISGSYRLLATYRGVSVETTFNYSTAMIGIRIRIPPDSLQRGTYCIPAVIDAKPGTKLTFTNEDSVPHTITSTDPSDGSIGKLFDSGIMVSGKSITITAPQAGRYHFFCTLHPSQVGVIEVSTGRHISVGISDSANPTLIKEQALDAEKLLDAAFLKRHFGPNVAQDKSFKELAKSTRIDNLTVVFWDIRRFTPLCNLLGEFVDLITEFLTSYRSSAFRLIDLHHGMFVKMNGDGIMALFCLPALDKEGKQDAINAVASAFKLRTEFYMLTESWKNKLRMSGFDRPVDIGLGCGMNTGRVFFGQFGGEDSELDAIGPAVNLAQRLESQAMDREILVSVSTALRIKDDFKLSETLRTELRGFGLKEYHKVIR